MRNADIVLFERGVVMRAPIKDAAYYEAYLALNARRLARFQAQLDTLEHSHVTGRRGCAAFIAGLCHSRICALYSSGADICEIAAVYPSYVAHLVQAVMPPEGYFDVVDAISLGVLLDAKDSLPGLKQIVQQTNMGNMLTDTLLHSMDNTWPITTSHDRCPWFVQFSGCAAAEREACLQQYLAGIWYQDHRDASWYDSHKSSANTYAGYWSFEAGAIAKIYGVQDSREWPYYPYDLVHEI